MTAASLAKRAFDVITAAAGLVIFAPVIGLLALLIALTQGTPIFFHQERVGRSGRVFTLIKFRTMTERRDSLGALLPDADRVTGIGRFMRRFRLDELPSFWLVLRGDMSMVGPRPLPPEILATMPGSSERHRVRPGFTGLAQVSGNTLLSNAEKLALDLRYVRSWSLEQDAQILMKTMWTLASGERRDERLIEIALRDQADRSDATLEGAPS